MRWKLADVSIHLTARCPPAEFLLPRAKWHADETHVCRVISSLEVERTNKTAHSVPVLLPDP